MNVNEWERATVTFRKIWGYENFRPPQGEIIRTLLVGKDALIILPTGGGKSLCFQLPAILQTGLTIVVSPLVALMENQVRQLRQLGLPGALLHSELSRQQRQQTLVAIARQELRLLYLSPETLLSLPVWQRISQPEIKITGLILDEVHCLIQWGTTFRPAYRRLSAVRRTLLQHKPSGSKIAVAAFTATADPQTQKAIVQALELQQPQTFLVSPYRANLKLEIQTVWTLRARKQKALNFIQARRNSGLVYVRSRRDSETLAQWFQSLGYAANSYHAGLSSTERRNRESSWLTGETQFVVCTSAFGMGIDKPDCAWIIHFHAPELLAEYIQEVGRGGRNGKLAEALTLISEPTSWLNPEDKKRSQFFRQNLQQQYRQAQQLMRKIPTQGEINKVVEQFPQAEITLGVLHSLGIIYWNNPFYYQKQAAIPSLNLWLKNQRRLQQQLRQYWKTNRCRWQFLLLAFGFTREAAGFSCGHCDNCLRNKK